MKDNRNGTLTIKIDINTMHGAGFNAFAPPQGELQVAAYLREIARRIEQGEREFTLAHPRECRGEGMRDVAARVTFRATKYKTARFKHVEKF
jgi:hypothetical protein